MRQGPLSGLVGIGLLLAVLLLALGLSLPLLTSGSRPAAVPPRREQSTPSHIFPRAVIPISSATPPQTSGAVGTSVPTPPPDRQATADAAGTQVARDYIAVRTAVALTPHPTERGGPPLETPVPTPTLALGLFRSEERRVGKEGRGRVWRWR